ncbi:MAG: hypothetical protein P4M08_03330 [Oligoflexia bacterium]|nr:hypothetical protein [Oligoflexia bacterium]
MSLINQYHSVNWDSLVAFGPYPNPKWDITIADQDATFDTVDADSLHLMELEVVVSKAQDAAVYSDVTRALQQAGVVLCEVQEGKTARLLRAMGLLR